MLKHSETFLQAQSIGHLGLTVDNEVYVIPLNYAYNNRRILFHCALTGRKLDMIRQNPNVCFEVSCLYGDPKEHAGSKCLTEFESVICHGTARVIEDLTERHTILQEFQFRYATPEKPRTSLAPERARGCAAVEITVTNMSWRRATGDEHGYGDRGEWSV